MDKNLLGRAVEHHGPDFLRQLQLEQEQIPANIFLFLQKHRPQVPEISDPQFILNVRRFVSKKADVLFKANDARDIPIRNPNENEDCYARMPPLETFMGIDQYSCKKHLFLSLEIRDIVIGEVTSIMDSGLVLQLLCLEGKNRDINDLHIPAFIPSKEIPKLFPTQNPVEGYQVKDYVRGMVLSVNPDTENIIISLMDRTIGESSGFKPLLGLIQEEDFPVEYRRKLHIRGLTFDELVNSILGFSNPGNVSYLLDNLSQKHDFSLMRGLHNLKIPEKEYADILKKQQSQKWAYHCVAQGINFFKEGKQMEAMQQLNKALQIDKTNVEALVARGALYANNESYSRALNDFEDALTINPKHPNAIKYAHETLLAQGKCHEDEKNYSEAKRCYQRALEVIPLSQEAKESLRYVQYREESDGSKEKLTLKSQSSHKETIEQLPVIQIDENKQSTRKKGRSFERDSSDERKARNKSRSPPQCKQLSDSLSSSDLRNASRSRKGQFEVVRGQRSQSPVEIMDQSSYRSVSREKEIQGKLKQRLTSSPHLQRDRSSSHELSVDKYQRELNLGRENWSSQSYTSISIKKDDKISGLGTESRTGQWMSDPKAMDYDNGKHPQKKEQDIVVRNKDREAHTEREQYHEYGKGDRRRVGPFQQQESYSSSRQWETSENQFIKRPELQSFKRETSITPTRDEVNDRLGLEDISSPEDHNLRHGFRLRAYSSHDDGYKHREFEKGDEKYKLHDHNMEKKAEEYDRYGKKYKRDRSQSSKERELTDYHPNSHARTNSKERLSPPEYHERMIISVSRKGMSSVKELESDLDEIKKHNKREFSPKTRLKTETEGHRSKEMQYESNNKQDRSITISKRERMDVKDTQDVSRMESLTRYSTRSHRDSRSRSPEYKYIKTEKNDRSVDEEYSRSYSKDKQKPKQRDIIAGGYKSYSKEIPRSPEFNRNKDETYGRSSRSPNYKKIKDEKRTWPTEGDTYQRVVALKPKSTASLDKTFPNQVIEDQLDTDSHMRSEQFSKIDIFSDRQDLTVSNDSQVKFSTYIPRSVKLKLQHTEKGINPENRSVETKSVLNVPKLDMKVRSSNIEIYDTKAAEDLKSFSLFNKTQNEPILNHQSKSPGKKRHSSKHVSRSRSRSYDKYRKKFISSKDHKSRHSKKSRSRSISQSHDLYRKKGYKSRNKSRSRSHDKYNKSHKSRSRSKSHDRHSSSQKEKRIPRFSNAADSKNLEARNQANVTKVDIPKISSRWDSPEEKKSRWTIAEDNKVIVSAEALLKAQQRIAAMLGASLISKSPPPHRRMKPEEKVALQKKWKELSVSPTDITEDEVAPLQQVLKQKAIEVEAKLVTEELVKKEISITDFRASEGKKSGHKNIKKLKGSLQPKWESESDSENKSGPKSKSRSRSRSKDKSSKSTGQCSDKKGGSHSREARSSSKKVLEKNNRSKSRERSGDKHHNKNSHKDYGRKFDKRSKTESGTDLLDVPDVKKAEKEEHRMFWLPKEQETQGNILRGFVDSSKSPRGLSRKKSYSRSRSKSRTPIKSSLGKEPTSGKGARKTEDHLKLYKKSKWSSDTDSSDNDVGKKTEKKRESLNELEDFLNKLKSEKKRKMSGDEKLK